MKVHKLLNLYEMSKPKKQGIDSLAVAPSAKIGENVYIGAFVYIGENTVIGDSTQIYPHFVGDGEDRQQLLALLQCKCLS